ncbi:MAG: helix-turn-helix transcriptional regulator [Bacteroidaceae bacterium]|nr:helix-turn-helix transcriptional regulator [Bacteroidaceae bacterium]MBR4783592.1 helix-turn-helix transcriptional regulator [Bacteroidaceae bacterium]
MRNPNALPFGLDEAELNRRLEQRLDDLAKKTKFYLRKDVSLKEISNALITNRTYASRMINKIKGCKFNDYVNNLRLEKAEELFHTKDYMNTHSIRDLANDCGFASVSTFRRAFAKKYDNTPLSYAKRNGFKGKK